MVAGLVVGQSALPWDVEALKQTQSLQIFLRWIYQKHKDQLKLTFSQIPSAEPFSSSPSKTSYSKTEDTNSLGNDIEADGGTEFEEEEIEIQDEELLVADTWKSLEELKALEKVNTYFVTATLIWLK